MPCTPSDDVTICIATFSLPTTPNPHIRAYVELLLFTRSCSASMDLGHGYGSQVQSILLR